MQQTKIMFYAGSMTSTIASWFVISEQDKKKIAHKNACCVATLLFWSIRVAAYLVPAQAIHSDNIWIAISFEQMRKLGSSC